MKNYFFLSLLLVGPHLCVGQQQVQFNADPSPQPMNQCVLVNQSNIGSMPTTLYAPNCIEFNDQNTSNILVNEAPDLFHTKAGKSIHMRSNVHIKPNAHFEIDEDPDYTLAWYVPGTVGVVGQYEKMEIGLNPSNELKAEIDNFFDNDPSNGDGLNPYNRHDIDIQMTFFVNGQPIDRADAFYYVPQKIVDSTFIDDTTSFNFRFRHAPRDKGVYTAEIELFISDQRINTSYITFEVVGSQRKGFLEKGKYNHHLRYAKTKESFFGVGQCIPWGPGKWWPYDSNTDTYLIDYYQVSDNFKALDKSMTKPLEVLHQHGGNFTRFVAAPWSLQFETEELGNFYPKRDHAWYLDKLTDYCNDEEIYFLFCMKIHSDFFVEHWMRHIASGWENNVYNINSPDHTGYASEQAPVSTVKEFFSSNLAKDHYKNYLRYIVSRFGYAQSVAGWQLMSEINDVDGYKDDEPGVRSAVHNWIDEMAAFLDTVQFDRHLTSVAATGDDAGNLDFVEDLDLFSSPYIDFTGLHTYSIQNFVVDTTLIPIAFNLSNNTLLDGVVGGDTLWIPGLDYKFRGKMRNRGLTAVYTAVRNLSTGSNGTLNYSIPPENRNMPFIFDEYGAVATNGDQNGLSIFEEFNICNGHGFHNDLWTSMCSGSAIPGLDWAASNRPEKWPTWEEEFYGIKEFFKDIDFETVDYNCMNYDSDGIGWHSAQRYPWYDLGIFNTNKDGKGNGNDYRHSDALEGYTMLSCDRNQGFGWLHNRSHYWYNLPPFDPCMDAMINGLAPWSFPVMHRPEDDDILVSGHRQVQLNEDYIVVRYLKAARRYIIRYYHPQTNAFLDEQVKWTALNGELTIKPSVLSTVHEDVAFKFILFDEDWKSVSSDSDFIDSSKSSRVEMDKVEIYPNPNKGKFSILLNTPVRDISVFNSLGLIVYTTESAQVGRNDIDLNVSSGIYTVRITLISNESIQKKIVIQ